MQGLNCTIKSEALEPKRSVHQCDRFRNDPQLGSFFSGMRQADGFPNWIEQGKRRNNRRRKFQDTRRAGWSPIRRKNRSSDRLKPANRSPPLSCRELVPR